MSNSQQASIDVPRVVNANNGTCTHAAPTDHMHQHGHTAEVSTLPPPALPDDAAADITQSPVIAMVSEMRAAEVRGKVPGGGGGRSNIPDRKPQKFSKKKEELRLDRAVSFELLKQCALSAMLDKGLATCVPLHPLVVQTIVHQCCYVANVMRGAKHRFTQALAVSTDRSIPPDVRAGRLLKAFNSSTWPSVSVAIPSQLSIGIIGCGTIGTQILEGLVSSRLFHATCLSVSTRQPSSLPAYAQEGVKICFNNEAIAESVDLLILGCLPAQFQEVARVIRGKVNPSCVILSTLLGVMPNRACTALEHPLCLSTDVDVTSLSALAQASTSPAAVLKVACLFPRHSLVKTESFVSLQLSALMLNTGTYPLGLISVLCSMLPASLHESIVNVVCSVTPGLGGGANSSGGGKAIPRLTSIVQLDEYFEKPLSELIGEHFPEVAVEKGGRRNAVSVPVG